MDQQCMILVSPAGTVITSTLEGLSGRANIAPGSAREDPLGGIEFDYEGSTEVLWDEQRTVTRDDERVFLDEEGDEFLESELRLVPAESIEVPTSEATTPSDSVAQKVITITMGGGLIQGVEGIPQGVTIRVLDFDIDGADPERISTTASGDKACVSEWQSEGAA